MSIQFPNYSYIQSIPQEIKSSENPLGSIDLKAAEGIQQDIPVFKNIPLSTIDFLTRNFEVLNLRRGCDNHCSHCLRNAGAKIQTINWDDFVTFVDGVKKINDRLDMNIFNGTKYAVFFDDSEALPLKSFDSTGSVHDITEATRKFYEALSIPLTFVTSGWNIDDDYTQNAAEKLVKYCLENPAALKKCLYQ